MSACFFQYMQWGKVWNDDINFLWKFLVVVRAWLVVVFDFGTGQVGYLEKSSATGTGRDRLWKILKAKNHVPVQTFSSLTSSFITFTFMTLCDRYKTDHLCSAKGQFQVSACILLFHVTLSDPSPIIAYSCQWLLTPAIWLESSYFGDLGSLGPMGPMCLWQCFQ